MDIDQLYGAESGELDAVRTTVEHSLGITMEPHESLYHGGEYYQYDALPAEYLILQRNADLLDGELAEPAFPQACVLLYVQATNRPAELAHSLAAAGFRLLRGAASESS